MANMLSSETDRWVLGVWRRLALPGSTLAQLLADAANAARDPGKSVRDCPVEFPTDRFSKASMVAWRVAFRLTREHREILFITIERKAA
jgi:hypothetical protein